MYLPSCITFNQNNIGLIFYHIRYEHMDPELGIVMEQSSSNCMDIYPFHKLDNEETGEMGSCQHYWTRKDISDEVRRLELDVLEQR